MERYVISTEGLEVRSVGGGLKIYGSIPYMRNADPPRRERLVQGCFKKTLLARKKVVALWSHDGGKVLASTANGSLVLRDTPTALEVEISPNDTSWARDAIQAVKSGDCSGLSFGAFPLRSRRSQSDGYTELLEMDLVEISPTSIPAFPDSHVEVRNRNTSKNHKDIHRMESYSNPWAEGLSAGDKIKHLHQRRADLVVNRRSLIDKAEGRNLTTAEHEEIGRIDDEYERVIVELNVSNRQAEMEASLSQRGEVRPVLPDQRVTVDPM